MPKYCRAPNCSNSAGRLGSDNRPVSFYKFPLKDSSRLQAWLRHMGREHWVPSCHQHLCSEHFTPSCFQWRWGVRYLQPDAVPSIFSPALPAQSSQRTRNIEKLVVLPLPAPQETSQAPREPTTATATGQVHLVVLGAVSQNPVATAPVCLTPLPVPPTASGTQPRVTVQHPPTGLGAALRALQQRVQRLQRRQERHQAQLQDLEQLAQQLCRENLWAHVPQGPLCLLPRPEESQTFTIICRESDITVVLAQGPAYPTSDVKPEFLETQTPTA
ncbi:CAP-Gly domain-containing linker protein 3 isoform X5 [Octodon degus]|uniref:CAP-Gly domain-containing linker protein 3 isoform X5 n=1 Tax=Octodon degus TaxID=10160 RepID=A0A6P6EZ99_OCTDE|nr:CAP-Gly domain-containing linker protein 3 isoform X5 [Octodon degus]